MGPFIGNHEGGADPVPVTPTIGLDSTLESTIVDAHFVTTLFVDNNV